jgi:nucleotidyltransferase substrate binding protein (TIGR01987 family)
MDIGGVNIDLLLKALRKFEAFRLNLTSEQEKAGAIHAFEYSFELMGKTLKKVLAEQGLNAQSPKETIRLAATVGLIQDPELWFDFLKKRNLTVHTYQEQEIENIISIFPLFSSAIKEILAHWGINGY